MINSIDLSKTQRKDAVMKKLFKKVLAVVIPVGIFLTVICVILNTYNQRVTKLPELVLKYDAENLTPEQAKVQESILKNREVVVFYDAEGKKVYLYKDAPSDHPNLYNFSWKNERLYDYEGPTWIFEDDMLSEEDEQKILEWTRIALPNPIFGIDEVNYRQYRAMRSGLFPLVFLWYILAYLVFCMVLLGYKEFGGQTFVYLASAIFIGFMASNAEMPGLMLGTIVVTGTIMAVTVARTILKRV